MSDRGYYDGEVNYYIKIDKTNCFNSVVIYRNVGKSDK